MGESELEVTPSELKKTITSFLTLDSAKELLKISSAEGDNGCRFFRVDENSASVNSDAPTDVKGSRDHKVGAGTGVRISDSLPSDEIVAGWYGMVPSIIYDWADASLQEAASTRLLEGWGVRQILALGNTLLDGLHQIHKEGLLHADIRPANIMFSGEAEEPGRYELIDYGSFGQDGQSLSAPNTGNDQHSLLGPSTLPQRASPFYAPERREGTEHESADTAVIYNPKKSGAAGPGKSNEARNHIVLQLGWKRKLLDDENRIQETIKQELEKRSVIEGDAIASARVQAGDRLRIRDLVLEVVGVDSVDPSIIHCSENVFRVFHDRLAVKSNQALAEGWSVHSVPRVIELRKVSAATDLYGIGAVLLYTAFSAGRRSRGTEADGKSSASDESTSRDAQSGETETDGQGIDTDFESLMKALNNSVYFNTVWTILDELVQQMEVEFSKPPQERTNNLSTVPFAKKDTGDARPATGSRTDNEADRTLGSRAENITALLTATSSGLDRVLEAFGNNTAHFCIFIHFVLALLHRRSELKEGASTNTKMPFAQSRTDPPSKNGPTAAARAYISSMSAWFGYEIDHACVWADQAIDRESALRKVGDEADPMYQARLIKLQASLASAKEDLATAKARLKDEKKKWGEFADMGRFSGPANWRKLKVALEDAAKDAAREE